MNIEEVAPVLNPETPTPETIETPESEPVKLTQTQLDALIRSKMSLAGKQAREDAQRLRIENERLKEVVSGKGSEEELERTKGLLAEERLKNQQVLDESIRRQKDLLISQEAAANNHVDTDTTLRLTRNNLRHDPATGGFTVVDDAGNPRLNANSEPMSVADFFKDFSSKKLHLVRGNTLSGAGGGGSVGRTAPPALDWRRFVGPSSSARDANALAQRDPRAYAEMKRQARLAGAIS